MSSGTARGKPFTKGDTRINRRGRPKSHDQLRALIQKLAWEQVGDSELTRLEVMIRAMLASKSAADRENILRHGWGDVPKEVELSGNQDKPLRIVPFDYGAAIAPIAGRPGQDSDSSGESEGNRDGPPLGEIPHGG